MTRALKVLQINKFFYLRGGAERQMFDITRLLEEHGHTVINFSIRDQRNLPSPYESYFAEKVDLGKFSLKNILKFFWNYDAVNKLEKLIKAEKPDIAHLHNIAHQLSPAIITVLKRYNIPVVQTLHDYKLVCPNYLLFSQNEICQKCRQRKYYNCWLRKCLKGSEVKSFLAMLEAYWRGWLKTYNKVDLFISPSQFLIDKYRELGFKGKIIRLPHFVNLPVRPDGHQSAAGNYILYFGRLSAEKGVDDLIESFALLKTDRALKIAGDGPELINLKKLAERLGLDDKIIFTGRLSGTELSETIAGADFAVLPAKWQENYPYALLEAMALKKAVICSRVGGMPEIIQDGVNGFTFTPGGAEELAQKMRYLLNHNKMKEKIETSAINFVRGNNNQERYYALLMDIYGSVLNS